VPECSGCKKLKEEVRKLKLKCAHNQEVAHNWMKRAKHYSKLFEQEWRKNNKRKNVNPVKSKI